MLRQRIGAGAIGGQEPVRAARRAPFIALVVLVLLGTLTCLLMLNTLSAADELEQQSIATSNAVTKAQAQQVRVDLAAKQAPAALAKAATALGLVPADKPAFLQIAEDGKVSLLGVPGAVSPPGIALQPAGTTATPPAATSTPTTSTPTAGATPAGTPKTTPTTTVTLPGGAR